MLETVVASSPCPAAGIAGCLEDWRGGVDSSEDWELTLVWTFGLNDIKPLEGFEWVSSRLLLPFSNSSASKVPKIDPTSGSLLPTCSFGDGRSEGLRRTSSPGLLHERGRTWVLLRPQYIPHPPTMGAASPCTVPFGKGFLFLFKPVFRICVGAKEHKGVLDAGPQAPFRRPEAVRVW